MHLLTTRSVQSVKQRALLSASKPHLIWAENKAELTLLCIEEEKRNIAAVGWEIDGIQEGEKLAVTFLHDVRESTPAKLCRVASASLAACRAAEGHRLRGHTRYMYERITRGQKPAMRRPKAYRYVKSVAIKFTEGNYIYLLS